MTLAQCPRSVRADGDDFLARAPRFPTLFEGDSLNRFHSASGDRKRALPMRVVTGSSVSRRVPADFAATPARVRVAVAESPEQIEAACGLVSKRYAWRGYQFERADDGAVHRTSDQTNLEITFVAATAEATIGTVTLRLDGPLGLRAEEAHREAIQSVRSADRRLCELTRLAVAESVDSISVLASLFGLAYAAGRSIHGVTDVFIEVNPRHVTFYSRVLGFVVAAGERLCERVRAPSVLLHAEVGELAERLEALALRAFAQPPLAKVA
jgi:hypothetical protein